MVKRLPSTPITITKISIVRMGLRPRPNLAMSAPPMMKPVAVMPRMIPHHSTAKSVSPYGSMSAM